MIDLACCAALWPSPGLGALKSGHTIKVVSVHETQTSFGQAWTLFISQMGYAQVSGGMPGCYGPPDATLGCFSMVTSHPLLHCCRTMVGQLLRYERIETTLPRAKELRRLADQVVTIGKEVSNLRQSCLKACSMLVL